MPRSGDPDLGVPLTDGRIELKLITSPTWYLQGTPCGGYASSCRLVYVFPVSPACYMKCSYFFVALFVAAYRQDIYRRLCVLPFAVNISVVPAAVFSTREVPMFMLRTSAGRHVPCRGDLSSVLYALCLALLVAPLGVPLQDSCFA